MTATDWPPLVVPIDDSHWLFNDSHRLAPDWRLLALTALVVALFYELEAIQSHWAGAHCGAFRRPGRIPCQKAQH